MLVFIAAVAAAAGEPANPSKGNGLLELCEAGEASWQKGLCYGYIGAVRDLGNDLHVLCYPANATNRQTIEIAVAGLRANPAERNKASDALVMKYLHAVFPCPKGSPPQH
jgi:hypothetical protein